MSHEIEHLADGTDAFFTAREPAWHKLGTVTANALTAEEALQTAKLGGWNIRTEPLIATVPTDPDMPPVQLPVEGKHVVLRTNPVTSMPDALGVVGNYYKPIQNEEAFAFLDNVVDEGGAHFETAGSLLGGRRTFMTMKLPESMLIGGQDAVDLYLLASTNHDGTGALRLDVTPTRVVCWNTLNCAFRNAQRTWKIRHTQTAQGRVAEARRALGLTFRYVKEFEKVANELVAVKMRPVDFTNFLNRLVPFDADKATQRAETQHQRIIDSITTLYREAPTQDNIRDTKWAALNAVAEYADWAYPVRGGDDARAVRAMTHEYTDRLKTKALVLLTK